MSIRRTPGEPLLFTAIVLICSSAVFLLTSGRCETSPPDDPDPGWHFSMYYRALHGVHLFNFPDSVSGGGLLNSIFLLPPALAFSGAIYGARGERRLARRAFKGAGGLLLMLLTLGIIAASASFHGV